MDKGHEICLMGKIKGLAEESRRTRKMMRGASTEQKYYKLRRVKNSIRFDARHHALAYAYLRKIPYAVVEKKCNEKPLPESILKVVMLHAFFVSFTHYKEHLTRIQNWLDGIK